MSIQASHVCPRFKVKFIFIKYKLVNRGQENIDVYETLYYIMLRNV